MSEGNCKAPVESVQFECQGLGVPFHSILFGVNFCYRFFAGMELFLLSGEVCAVDENSESGKRGDSQQSNGNGSHPLV